MRPSLLVRVALTTLAYLSVAWILLISYQSFTMIAVNTLVQGLGSFAPSTAVWLNQRSGMIVFIHGFAWIFVLTSTIPTVILGKGGRVFTQFLLALTLTFIGVEFPNVLNYFFGNSVMGQISDAASTLNNPCLAVLYLSAPYIAMFSVDFFNKLTGRRRGEEEQPSEAGKEQGKDGFEVVETDVQEEDANLEQEEAEYEVVETDVQEEDANLEQEEAEYEVVESDTQEIVRV